MNLAWDYTDLARWYGERPGYGAAAIDRALAAARTEPGMLACDVGAGTGNLTAPLADRGLRVVAVEPNAAMRAIGRERLRRVRAVSWLCSIGEATALAGGRFDLLAFGSSLNVLDAGGIRRECRRLLAPGGHVVCLWNYRRLDDPLQAEIESAIRRRIPGWSYGSRRTDPIAALRCDAQLEVAAELGEETVHRLVKRSWLDAWRAHATLRRQAGDAFAAILAEIAAVLDRLPGDAIDVPYRTSAWVLRRWPPLTPPADRRAAG